MAMVGRLVTRFGDLRPLYEDHVRENDELLPHVLFGRLTDWIVRAYLAAPHRGDTWKAVIDQLETEFEHGDDNVRELIAVSFLENLPYPGEEGADIAEHLGPNLRAELHQLRGRPSP
jgi:hypothetical protein